MFQYCIYLNKIDFTHFFSQYTNTIVINNHNEYIIIILTKETHYFGILIKLLIAFGFGVL